MKNKVYELPLADFLRVIESKPLIAFVNSPLGSQTLKHAPSVFQFTVKSGKGVFSVLKLPLKFYIIINKFAAKEFRNQFWGAHTFGTSYYRNPLGLS